MSWLFREPDRDPRLGEALRQLEAHAAPREADQLRQRIVAAARTRSVAPWAPAPRWWEWIDRWIPVAVPVGLAASLAAGLLLPSSGEMSEYTSYPVEVAPDSALVTAAYSEELGAEQVAARLIAPQGGEWLFQQALIQ